MDFEAYLVSKKIDSVQFANAEPNVWSTWKREFDQIHPNSFTAQKLYLINPVRRKYPLKSEPTIVAEIKPDIKEEEASGQAPAVQPSVQAKPAVPRPVFKPKPKMS
jgi:hypothetical protein